ncbi:MAG: hypothetical protein QOE58_3136, partial [Actinomycetota bacterium]|nr:hypothetical protein [Actinomycetota bacterium]
RLAQLPSLHLERGSHDSFEAGLCVNEAAAWLAGEPHSDRPSCVSPVLRSYLIRLNDGLDNEHRQLLLPYAARIVGTAGDGQDGARLALVRKSLLTELLPAWLHLAGMGDQIPVLAALVDSDDKTALRAALVEVRDHAWARRQESIEALKAKIYEALAKHPDEEAAVAAVAPGDEAANAAANAVTADVAAAAVAAVAAEEAADSVTAKDTTVVVALAVSLAVADATDAHAVQASVADTEVAMVSVGEAAVAAIADAAVAAVAALEAAAAAVAAAAACPDPLAMSDYWIRYDAAYETASRRYESDLQGISAQVRDLADSQPVVTLRLLDTMIEPAAMTSGAQARTEIEPSQAEPTVTNPGEPLVPLLEQIQPLLEMP